jgi:2,5-diamino-6-(ribosylamino)-4(3H)-pyrimidinone 5'-phosphate reductase
MVPHVVLHVEASLDGRIDWIRPDIGRFHALAARFQEEAILTGADTLLEGPGLPETDDVEAPAEEEIGGDGPLLVVVDSRGRLDVWHWLRRQQYWRDALAVVSEATPAAARQRLSAKGVDTISTTGKRVDLRAALEQLSERFGVRTVRVDSGGALSGALLRAGLLDEVSVLVDPVLVGGVTPRTFVRGPDPASFADVAQLRLAHLEALDDGTVWLRYDVRS